MHSLNIYSWSKLNSSLKFRASLSLLQQHLLEEHSLILKNKLFFKFFWSSSWITEKFANCSYYSLELGSLNRGLHDDILWSTILTRKYTTSEAHREWISNGSLSHNEKRLNEELDRAMNYFLRDTYENFTIVGDFNNEENDHEIRNYLDAYGLKKSGQSCNMF